ncbi:MAG: (Fe-S)-binding protein [Phycisphaeraceae bacterium]
MKVSFFVTCLTDTFYPRVGQAVVAVLEHLGHEVEFREAQTCCGQPMFNTGCHGDAAALARKMIDVFDDADVVVTPSGSCCAMIHDYYEDLLGDDPHYGPRAKEMVGKTHEFAKFLLDVEKVDLAELGCRWPGKLTYHYSCHLRGLGMRDEAVRLLNQIEGVELVPLEKTEQCCGFGGTFAVKYPQISGSMVRDKVDCVKKTGADVLVCNDGGCSLNITGSLHREQVPVMTKHLAEIIAEGLGLLPIEAPSPGTATQGVTS